jgi:beta-phosphoglucomutase-like phosphatase (HAD superfamily)
MEHVKHVKPAPDLFLLALKRMGLSPNEAVVIEDAPKGLQSGLAAGICTVITRTDWTRECVFEGAGAVLDSLDASLLMIS